MRKKLFLVLGCMLLLIIGIGLAALVERFDQNKLEPGEIYKSKNVRVVELEPGKKPMIRMSESAGYDEKVAFADTTVVVSGTVEKVQEAEAFYYSKEYGQTFSSKMTIFELAVDEHLYTAPDALAGKDSLRIGVWFTSYGTNSLQPMIKEGKSFLVSCVLASELEDDVAYRKEYMDCWILTPRIQLIECAGSKYIMADSFAQYMSSKELIANVLQASEEQIEDYVNPDKDDTLSEISLQDPNGLLAALKDRVIGWKKVALMGDDLSRGIWSYAQSCYAIDKKTAEDLIVDIVKRNN